MISNQRKQALSPYSAIIWLGVFVPGHLGGFIVEQIYVAFVVLCAIALFATRRTNSNYFNISKKGVGFFFLLLELFYVFSYFHAEISFSAGPGGFRDYLELARYLIYLIFIILVLSYHPKNSKHLAEGLITATVFFSLFIAFLYIVQVPMLTGFFEDFVYVTTRDDLSQISTGGRVRFAAPFPNANYLAYFLCMALVYLLFFTTGLRRFVLIGACFCILFLTGSRTGWVGAAVLVGLWQILHIQLAFSRRGNFGNLILMFSISGALALLLFGGFLPSVARVSEVNSAIASADISSIASFAHRLEHNLFIWDSVKESLIWGLGPAKYSLTTVIDNQYLLWITRQGIVGFTIICLGIYFLFHRMMRAAPGTSHVYGVLCFFLVIGLFGMTGAFLNNFRLFLLTLFFAAVILDSCLTVKAYPRVRKE
jgi:hypothetical protein